MVSAALDIAGLCNKWSFDSTDFLLPHRAADLVVELNTQTSLPSSMFKLCFGLDPDAPPLFRERWTSFKKACEGGQECNRPVSHAWIVSCKPFPSLRTLVVENVSEGGIRVESKEAHLRYRDGILDRSCCGDVLILVEAGGAWKEEDLECLALGFRCMASKTLESGALCVSSWRARVAIPKEEELAFANAQASSLELSRFRSCKRRTEASLREL